MIELWTSYDSIPCSKPFLNVTTNGNTILCKNARCYADGNAVLERNGVKKVIDKYFYLICEKLNILKILELALVEYFNAFCTDNFYESFGFHFPKIKAS